MSDVFKKTQEEKDLLKKLKSADKLDAKVRKAKADYHLNGKQIKFRL